MKFEIKVTGNRASGKTAAVRAMLSAILTQNGNYKVIEVEQLGETEIWHVIVE